jgi:hypothetical protein
VATVTGTVLFYPSNNQVIRLIVKNINSGAYPAEKKKNRKISFDVFPLEAIFPTNKTTK